MINLRGWNELTATKFTSWGNEMSQAEARNRFFQSLGTPDNNVWAPIINPMFRGGPAWPGRPGWRRVCSKDSTFILSDGLSESFDDDAGDYGFGLEILLETTEVVPELMLGSPMFRIVHEISHNVAHHGAFRELVEEREVGTLEVNIGDDEEVKHLLTDDGTVGVYLGLKMPSGQTHYPSPGGDVLIVTAKLLALAELEYVLEHGSDGYKLLRQRFTDTGSHHRSWLSRPSVV